MTTLQFDLKTTLPDGFYARPVDMNDLEPMVDLFAAYTLSQVGRVQNTVEGIRGEWEGPTMDLANNTIGVFTEQGQPVGYMEFWDMAEPHVRFIGWSAVHPDYREQGIETFLIDWLIERGKQEVSLSPEGARVMLLHFVDRPNQILKDHLTRQGFQHIRSSHVMRIDFEGPVQPAVLPEGITIRSIANEEEERLAMHAAWEAFEDHWGHVPEPFENFYKRQKYFIDSFPFYHPSLWFIALDGNEIAGVSLCYDHIEEDEDQGWVGTLGVRRPWRKRGVGLALLQHSFYEFSKRGKVRAGLGVDASSLTGATRLYERGGMYVLRSNDCYELELRPGQDLTTQSV